MTTETPTTNKKCGCGAQYKWNETHFSCPEGMKNPERRYYMTSGDTLIIGSCGSANWIPEEKEATMTVTEPHEEEE